MSNGSFEIGEIILLNSPSGPQYATTKSYVDAAAGPQGTPAQKRLFYQAQKQSNAGAYSTSLWTSRTAAVAQTWNSICWSPDLGLFAAVSSDGGTSQAMTSTNGIDWILQSTVNPTTTWASVCWSAGLGKFVAVDVGSPHVMYSSDGVSWQYSANTALNTWTSVCWSPDLALLVTVAKTLTDRVMTSSNSINWTSRTEAEANSWQSVCWSPELGLFCAVSSDGTHRVMTSDNGINWVARTAAAAHTWQSVCWSPELNLFCAVGNDGNSIMTSDNGTNWVSRTATGVTTAGWNSICWAAELGLFVAVPILNGDGIITSTNGIDWKVKTKAENNTWTSICWAPEIKLFAAVSSDGNDRVMTSNRFDDVGAPRGLIGEFCTQTTDSNAGGFNTSALGFQSFATGFQTIAAGNNSTAEGSSSVANSDSSHAEGNSFTGNNVLPFTISGTTVTISSFDATLQFFNGDSIVLYNLSGGTNNALFFLRTTITSSPVFSTDTTFNIATTLDDRTGGFCVDTQFGLFAHAEGESQAIGSFSHAEGNTTTTGDYSHSEGFNSVAAGENSHAEGHDTKAFDDAHAEGSGSTAYGQASHAEGESTSAIGSHSHSECSDSKAIGDRSHAEGDTTSSNATQSHTEGVNTRTGNAISAFTISGSTLTISGDVTSKFVNGHDIALFDLTGGTNNTLFAQSSTISTVPAFSGGNTTFDIISGPLDDRTAGNCVDMVFGAAAHAEGDATTANGASSHAEGNSTIASGDSSHAEGNGTTASGSNSHTQGNNTTASGANAHAEGNNSIASGANSHAEGNSTTAYGPSSHAEGTSNAFSDFTHAEGQSNKSVGTSSHTEGNNVITGFAALTFAVSGTTVTLNSTYFDARAQFSNGDTVFFATLTGGSNNLLFTAFRTISSVTFTGTDTTFTINSILDDRTAGTVYNISRSVNAHAEGASTSASGAASHAEGNGTFATGDNSHAEGNTTTASGIEAHAEGVNTIAGGSDSHAEGNGSVAWGNDSHSEGFDTQAIGDYAHAEGNITSASGFSSHGEGGASAGYQPKSCSISGTTITINGDVARQFTNGDTVRFFNLTNNINPTSLSNGLPTQDRTIVTVPMYNNGAGTITRFDINTALNGWQNGLVVDVNNANNAHAEGNSLAIGNEAHAEGSSTTAVGGSSHSEGASTTAWLSNAHAEGTNTIATGAASHAEGSANSIADFSHAEGSSTFAYSMQSHAEGINTQAGLAGQVFTCPDTQTIVMAGDVSAQFTNGDVVRFYQLTGGFENRYFVVDSTILTGPQSGFQGSNTAFTITPNTLGDRTDGLVVDTNLGMNAHAEGNGTQALAESSHAQGLSSVARLYGQDATASGQFATPGDAQSSKLVMRNLTTNNTPTQLYLDGVSKQLLIPINTTYIYRIDVVGRQTGSVDTCAAFFLSGFITTQGTFASTRLNGAVQTLVQDTGSSTWAAAETADTTNGALMVTVTGQNSKNISWVATIWLTEVAGA